MRDIAADKSDRTYVKAENLLTMVYKEKYREKIKIPSNTQNKMGNSESDELAVKKEGFTLLDENHKLKCFPNPFSAWTTIEVYVTEGITLAQVIIFNTVGIEVKRFKVNEGYNALTLMNEDLPNAGIYFCILYGNEDLIEKTKLVILK